VDLDTIEYGMRWSFIFFFSFRSTFILYKIIWEKSSRREEAAIRYCNIRWYSKNDLKKIFILIYKMILQIVLTTDCLSFLKGKTKKLFIFISLEVMLKNYSQHEYHFRFILFSGFFIKENFLPFQAQKI